MMESTAYDDRLERFIRTDDSDARDRVLDARWEALLIDRLEVMTMYYRSHPQAVTPRVMARIRALAEVVERAG